MVDSGLRLPYTVLAGCGALWDPILVMETLPPSHMPCNLLKPEVLKSTVCISNGSFALDLTMRSPILPKLYPKCAFFFFFWEKGSIVSIRFSVIYHPPAHSKMCKQLLLVSLFFLSQRWLVTLIRILRLYNLLTLPSFWPLQPPYRITALVTL